MSPSRDLLFDPGVAQRMLPGLEYARALIDTAIRICQNAEKEPEPRRPGDAPPSTSRN